MSEMLANQFFLARNYGGAVEQFELALAGDPRSKMMRKKLIICLNALGEVRRALPWFGALLKEAPEVFLHSNPMADDCPCAELVYDAERLFADNRNSVDFLLRLGMLWIFSDPEESRSYFTQAARLAPHDRDIKTILTLLKTIKPATTSLS